MKTTFIILLLVVPFLGFCQKNHSIDFVGSVDYSYRTLHTSDDNLKESKIQRNDDDKAAIRWRAGFNYNKRVGKKLYFKSGLRLALLGYTSRKDRLIFASYFSPDLTWVQNPPPVNVPDPSQYKVDNQHLFIELPATLRYEFSGKKFTPFVEAGFGVTYFLFTRKTSQKNGNQETTITKASEFSKDLNRIQFEGIIAFGGIYKINNKLQLFAQPTLRYHLTSMWSDEIKERLWSAGLEFGLRRWF